MVATVTRRIGRETSPVTFAEKLRQLLDARDWSVNELALRADVPYTTLKAYFQVNKKTNKARLPTYANVVAICRALGISTDSFQDCSDWGGR